MTHTHTYSIAQHSTAAQHLPCVRYHRCARRAAHPPGPAPRTCVCVCVCYMCVCVFTCVCMCVCACPTHYTSVVVTHQQQQHVPQVLPHVVEGRALKQQRRAVRVRLVCLGQQEEAVCVLHVCVCYMRVCVCVCVCVRVCSIHRFASQQPTPLTRGEVAVERNKILQEQRPRHHNTNTHTQTHTHTHTISLAHSGR